MSTSLLYITKHYLKKEKIIQNIYRRRPSDYVNKHHIIPHKHFCSLALYRNIIRLCWLIATSQKGTHIWAASWQNQQNGLCAQRRLRSAWAFARSDQSLRRARLKTARFLSYPLSAQGRLIRLGECPGWSESSLGALVILLVLSCSSSKFYHCLEIIDVIVVLVHMRFDLPFYIASFMLGYVRKQVGLCVWYMCIISIILHEILHVRTRF